MGELSAILDVALVLSTVVGYIFLNFTAHSHTGFLLWWGFFPPILFLLKTPLHHLSLYRERHPGYRKCHDANDPCRCWARLHMRSVLGTGETGKQSIPGPVTQHRLSRWAEEKAGPHTSVRSVPESEWASFSHRAQRVKNTLASTDSSAQLH